MIWCFWECLSNDPHTVAYSRYMDRLTIQNTRKNAAGIGMSGSQATNFGAKSGKRKVSWSPQFATSAQKRSSVKMSDSELESMLTTDKQLSKPSNETSNEPSNELSNEPVNELPSSQLPSSSAELDHELVDNNEPTSAQPQNNEMSELPSRLDIHHDNAAQSRLGKLLRNKEIIEQEIQAILASGITAPSSTTTLNIPELKSEFEGSFSRAVENMSAKFQVKMQKLDTFSSITERLELLDEYLAMRHRVSDLVTRLKAGTLIPVGNFNSIINPAFKQISNFDEVSANQNGAMFEINLAQIGLHYLSVLEELEVRITNLRSSLHDCDELLATYRHFRPKSFNQKLNAIFYKLRLDRDRSMEIGADLSTNSSRFNVSDCANDSDTHFRPVANKQRKPFVRAYNNQSRSPSSVRYANNKSLLGDFSSIKPKFDTSFQAEKRDAAQNSLVSHSHKFVSNANNERNAQRTYYNRAAHNNRAAHSNRTAQNNSTSRNVREVTFNERGPNSYRYNNANSAGFRRSANTSRSFRRYDDSADIESDSESGHREEYHRYGKN